MLLLATAVQRAPAARTWKAAVALRQYASASSSSDTRANSTAGAATDAGAASIAGYAIGESAAAVVSVANVISAANGDSAATDASSATDATDGVHASGDRAASVASVADDVGGRSGHTSAGNSSEAGEDALLKRLLEETASGEWLKVKKEVLREAAKQVAGNRSAIMANFRKRGLKLPVEVDLIWPGHGYSSISAGGQYEVLSLLEKAGLIKIGRITGASGGAASALLALAGGNTAEPLLAYYMAYAKWVQEGRMSSGVAETLRSTHLWLALYRHALQSDVAFERVRRLAWPVVSCGGVGTSGYNSVLHNFADREQAVQTFYASGDASVSGMLVGTKIPGISAVIYSALLEVI